MRCLCDAIGLNSGNTAGLRRELRKARHESLGGEERPVRRATEGTSIAVTPSKNTKDSLAVVWGCEDFVSSAKRWSASTAKPEYEKLAARRRDGRRTSHARPHQRSQQVAQPDGINLSILLGQILSPGSALLSQLSSTGGELAKPSGTNCQRRSGQRKRHRTRGLVRKHRSPRRFGRDGGDPQR